MVSRSLHEFGHLLTHLGGVAHNVDASGLEGSDFVRGSTLATSDDGTGVAHAAAWRSGLAGDEANHGQVAVVVLTEPVGGLFLSLATDLTDHDDTLGLGVIHKLSEHVNEVGTVEGVTADTDDGRLTEALGRGLVDSLVSEGARTGHNTDLALGVDVAWHDADLALAGLDDTWAVGSNQARLVLRLHDRLDLDHIKGGDALGNAHDEVHLGLDSLENSVSGERRRHVDDGSLGISGGLGLGDRAENGQAQVLSAGLALVDTTDDLGAVGEGLLGVESTLKMEKKVSQPSGEKKHASPFSP